MITMWLTLGVILLLFLAINIWSKEDEKRYYREAKKNEDFREFDINQHCSMSDLLSFTSITSLLCIMQDPPKVGDFIIDHNVEYSVRSVRKLSNISDNAYQLTVKRVGVIQIKKE